MRKAILCLLFLSVLCLSAQTVYKLDSCKAMAKENNLVLQAASTARRVRG